MKVNNIKERLNKYIDAGFPIIYVNTYEEGKADKFIADVKKDTNRKVVEWNEADGQVYWDIKNEKIIKRPCFDDERGLEGSLQFLKEEDVLENNILVIKDVHFYFNANNPRIIGMIKKIANKILNGLDATIIIVSSVVSIPIELEKYTTVVNIEHLNNEEIRNIILKFIDEYNIQPIVKVLLDDMVLAFKGLSEYEIINILSLAYAVDGCFTRADLKLINEQKQQIIMKSGILEMIQVKESLDDIGGLNNLKKWLKKKAVVFNNLNKAVEFGVDIPKGVLIAGVPGCGKSLNAKAVAKLFDVPLLRLDMGRLMGKYVGESEANMRKATELADAIAPCVIWIDEIEKAFAGIGESGGNVEITTRLFGHFLTWMQEKTSSAFVVATANDIFKLPPELIRKGRFDEIFYVGLPNEEERKKIFEIHINKRRKNDLPNIDISKVVKLTYGYSGADIEGIVKEAVESVFANGKLELKTNDLIEVIENTHSLSEIMKDKLERMSKEYENRKFKNASY